MKKLSPLQRSPSGQANPPSAGDTLSTIFFYFSILIFLIGFNFTDSPPPFGWYQQFMPNLGGKQIQDIVFIDSLTGYASANQTTDSSYILKTTNGGDNWQIIYRQLYNMTRLQFLNSNTGYAGGAYVHKTTNGGINWTIISSGLGVSAVDISVLNEDTIWFVESESLSGGVFFTSNGGQNWTQQLYLGSANPDKIYMFDKNFGFISTKSPGALLYRTIDGGANWNQINSTDGFRKISFVNSSTGWKVYTNLNKTTDGGSTWQPQIMPSGGIIHNSNVYSFTVLNKDTVWGCGGYVIFPSNQVRGLIYRTTNGGDNWLFQIPDTSIGISYYYIDFNDRFHGWVYSTNPTGIHTTTGGDIEWFTVIKQISSGIPKQYKLYQNYPNPFNPVTNINYKISKTTNVLLEVFDINGRRLKILVNQKQGPGEYTVEFDGSSVSSGVYFYRLQVINEKGGIEYAVTKKMLMLK